MKAKRVLLVNSNRMRPPVAPIALDYIGAALRGAGHEVDLLDLCLEPDAGGAARALSGRGHDLVAVTFRNTDDCYFASRASFVDILRDDVRLLRRHGRGPIAIGGGGVSLMPLLLLEHSGADFAVCGNGEPALLQLLQALDGEVAFGSVPGLVWREGDGWNVNEPSRADLGALDLSARDIVDNRGYFEQGGQIGIEMKRGCSRRCIYCADPVIKGRGLRLRAPSEIVEEMRNLLVQGVDCLHLCDSEINVPLEHARAVCEAILESGMGSEIRWYAYASPTPFTGELAGLMKRAGCAGVDFGVDAGCDAMLAALGRDFDVQRVENTARLCHGAGIPFMYDLLLGGPGETPATLAETVNLMKRISPDRVGLSLGVRVYPGTALASEIERQPALARGLVGQPGGLEPCFYMSPALGDDPTALLRNLVGDDRRFFLPGGGTAQDYNYNDNAVLQDAIRRGYRGAYWDILRKLQDGIPPGAG